MSMSPAMAGPRLAIVGSFGTFLALMKISSSAVIVGLACSFATAAAPRGGAQTTATPEKETGLQRTEEILNDATGKGYAGAVLVELNDQVILRRAYGLANRERKLPFKPTTISQIGSLTKQFTAPAVAALAQEKRLKYSDSIGAYLAGDPRLRGITIHQLLTRNYKYSNLGYSLLGALVEQVSGQTLEAFLINRFLGPAGMVNTRYSYQGRDTALFARGYAQGKLQPLISDRLAELDDPWWNLKGNGGMQSTLDDMYAWYRSFKDGKHITADMRREILAPHVPAENGI